MSWSEIGRQSQTEGMSGLFEYFEMLAAVVPRGEEFHPQFIKHPDGEHSVPGFYPPPAADSGNSRSAELEETA